MLGSKQLLRTNPALTANFKLVVNSAYKLYLESYDSNTELSDQKYKHFSVNETAYLTERVPSFFRGMPNDLAFEVRKHTPTDTVQTDFNLQLDETYWAGPKEIEDRWHAEDHEYHAPLYVDTKNMPKYFVVLRVDGPGDVNLKALPGPPTAAGTASREVGFRDEILTRWKCVKLFDMGKTTPLGQFLDKNFSSNEYFPREPFSLNLRKYQFSRWNGYDIKLGGFGSKSYFMQETMSAETTHFELEESVTAGFRKNGVAMPHVLNLKFLFDDTAGTITDKGITSRRKWSLNRYYGFYLDDLKAVRQVSPYPFIPLRQDLTIKDNVFKTLDGKDVDPTEKGWPGNASSIYIKRGDDFLSVQRIPLLAATVAAASDNESADAPLATPAVSYRYVIIDSLNNAGGTDLLRPTKTIAISYQGDADHQFLNGKIIIKNTDDTPLDIPDYQENGTYMIEIDGEFYTLQRTGTTAASHFAINSDTIMQTTASTLLRELAGAKLDDISFEKPDEKNGPLRFKIYQAQFTEVADMDFDRLDTGFSQYEYEGTAALTYTDEPKLFARDEATPLADDIYQEKNYTIVKGNGAIPTDRPPFYMPASSEYVAGDDLWVVRPDGTLTDIWNKNPQVNKWGVAGSVSHADYPYKLNNSLTVGGAFNRAPSHLAGKPDRRACNLDWFYTVGAPRSENTSIPVTNPERWKASTEKMAFRSLEVDAVAPTAAGTVGPFWTYQYFDTEVYENPNTSFDYFDWFFTQQQRMMIDDNSEVVRSAKKYATFSTSDGVNGPIALFRGLHGELRWTAPTDPMQVDVTRTTPATEASGYKFSAVLTKRQTRVPAQYGQAGITVYVNKIYKNVLVCVWVYTPYNSKTSFESIYRDDLYKQRKLMYDFNTASPKEASIGSEELTLLNVINAINNPGQSWGFTSPAVFTVIDNVPKYAIDSAGADASNHTKMLIVVDGIANYKQGEYITVPAFDGTSRKVTYRVASVEFATAKTNITVDAGDNVPDVLPVAATPDAVVSSAKDRRPFSLVLDAPDLVSVRQSVYKMEPVTVDIKPRNTVSSLVPSSATVPTNVLVKLPEERLVQSPYDGQPIGRDHSKLSTDEVPGTDIYRYSGSYMPILRELELFSPARLVPTRAAYLEDGGIDNGLYHPLMGIGRLPDGRITTPMTVPAANVGDIIVFTVGYEDPFNPLVNYKFCRVEEIGTYDIFYDFDQQGNPIVGPGNRLVLDYVVLPSLLGSPQMTLMRYSAARTSFDTSLQYFGTMRELLLSKMNTSSNTLLQTGKRDSKYRSVYPMVDEYGMTAVPRFVFKSTWDDEYFYESVPYTMNRWSNGGDLPQPLI